MSFSASEVVRMTTGMLLEFLFFFDDAQDFKPIHTGQAQV